MLAMVSYNLSPKISSVSAINLSNLFHCRSAVPAQLLLFEKVFPCGCVSNHRLCSIKRTLCWMFCTNKHCEHLMCAVLFTVGMALFIILAQIIKFIRSCLTIDFQAVKPLVAPPFESLVFLPSVNYCVNPAQLLDLGYRGKMSKKCR